MLYPTDDWNVTQALVKRAEKAGAHRRWCSPSIGRAAATPRPCSAPGASDGATTLNLRLVLKTKDHALIAMTYRGVRHGPPDIIGRIERGEVVDPTSYYFRINPLFETAAANYDWINRVVAVGIGHRLADGPIYSIFEVL
jgi:hypothetical protein